MRDISLASQKKQDKALRNAAQQNCLLLTCDFFPRQNISFFLLFWPREIFRGQNSFPFFLRAKFCSFLACEILQNQNSIFLRETLRGQNSSNNSPAGLTVTVRGARDELGVLSVARGGEGENLDGVVGELPEVLEHGGDGGQTGDFGQRQVGLRQAAGVGRVQDLHGGRYSVYDDTLIIWSPVSRGAGN